MKLEVLSVRVYGKKGEGSVALPLKEPPRPIHPGVGKSSPTLMEGTLVGIGCECLDSHKNVLLACVEVTTQKGH
jgi:hypothetical protein